MNSDKLDLEKLAFGGGCHWCTEAVFQSLIGVRQVEQGYVSSEAPYDTFSEAVIVHYDPEVITVEVLLEIHLRTHNSTKDHSMRDKYRSAVYTFDSIQHKTILQLLERLQTLFTDVLITTALPFKEFKTSRAEITNYYYSNPEKAFCKQYIDPKLQLLLRDYSSYLLKGKTT